MKLVIKQMKLEVGGLWESPNGTLYRIDRLEKKPDGSPIIFGVKVSNLVAPGDPCSFKLDLEGFFSMGLKPLTKYDYSTGCPPELLDRVKKATADLIEKGTMPEGLKRALASELENLKRDLGALDKAQCNIRPEGEHDVAKAGGSDKGTAREQGPEIQTDEEWAKEFGVTVSLDGDKWFARAKSFINLQESAAGFGPTIAEAIYHLRQQQPRNDNEFHHYQRPYISLDFQEGPVKEVGVNGCQNEDIIDILLHRMGKLQEAFPCDENGSVIANLEICKKWLKMRTQKRVEQGVEGQNKPHVS